ncbi:MAG: HDIG domain-containing protein [Acidobacteria bacterium]|nr:MAG: HDIG domain-containing protein [Acidobacteriota bacterium]REK01796.1 MAG: HDIG domain-containing protein [Acidobacteriota bacterium]REK14752.1 MAG: HDIG domain-containing protein [Acidobacteriota bacterium]REK45467.1 MAG: HDIG domain-containing protein [Acidobacteriota bacterium]
MSTKLKKDSNLLDRFRKRAVKYLRVPYDKVSPAQRFWIGFSLLALITTLLISNPAWRTGIPAYNVGDIARETVVSPADITVENEKETQEFKEAARLAIKPIFNLQSNNSEEALRAFRSAWEGLQRSKGGVGRSDGDSGTVEWNGPGGKELGRVFASRDFSRTEISAIERVLEDSTKGTIYDDKDRPQLQGEVTLVDPKNPSAGASVTMPSVTWIPLSEARTEIREGLNNINSLSEEEVGAFEKALSPLVQPNAIYDSAATARARDEMAKAVQPSMIELKRSQTIVREGDTVSPGALAQIAAIQSYSNTSRQLNRFFGLLAIITALFWVAWKFIQHRGFVNRLSLSEEHTFVMFGFVVIVQTLLMAIFFRITEYTAESNMSAPLNDPTLWAFAIPFAFSSLLMTLLADRRTALFTGLFCALLAGLLAPRGLEFAIYAAISSAVAVYGIGRYRSRQSVTFAGIFVGAANAATAVALIAYTQQPLILNTILLAISCGLLSGLITAAVTAMFLPICESLFGILTDVKLLELSNADLPLLGQLALRAPGTNQHSHAVGQLAEEACRTVNANGLLARIGALYHDIGKTAAPEHFVENQRGKNPHDRLKPAQSARIIISHVTYGAKLAKDMGLPARIVDFIPQHHGTRTLHYFLTKARNEAGKGEEIHEKDFRYPGPKPQFKEAAIMMIADSCEAAARSLSEPTPENIRFIVTKIIDAILADDQLDECDLTLRELTQIRESMIKSLVSIYHSRVDYPGYNPPASKTLENIIIPKDLDEEPVRGPRYVNPADIPVSPGGEVEDEAIVRTVSSDENGRKDSEEPEVKAKGTDL